MGFFGKLSFSHVTPVVLQARKGEVPIESLHLPEEQKAEIAYNQFQANWDAALKAAKPGTKPALRNVLWKTFGKDLMLAGLFKLGWSVCVIMGAFFFVRSILTYVEGKAPFNASYAGYVLTAAFFVDAWLLGVCLQRMGYGCMCVGIRMRAALINFVCKKSFQMASIDRDAAADVVSFVASDISKVFDGCLEIHYLWTAPIEAGAILIILAVLVGVYALPGWGVICIVLPAQYIFGWRIIKNKYENAKNTQARGGIIQELLPAMKLVKYYAWEAFFEKNISDIRARELRIQLRNATIKTFNIAMVFATPPVTACVIFAAYEFGVGRLTPNLAFTTLSLFNILRFPLVVLPKALRAASEALTSISRLDTYLNEDVPMRQKKAGTPGVTIKDAVFRHQNKSAFSLNVPEFNVVPGELVAVVGRVGSGKSSLVQAVLGNMVVEKGTIQAGGKVAYVPQDPWCQNLSIRDNILFGQTYDEGKYAQVIHDCALELDLQILPMADDSKAGLRGINLSGGQRQRLNIARAAYFDGELVLLDNALSALDHHTSHHIFQHLLKEGMREKAVILITHQVEFVSQCDKVCIMDEGNCIYFGPWNAAAQQMMSRVLPASHLLAAAGSTEERKEVKKKGPAPSRTQSGLKLAATNLADNLGKAKRTSNSLPMSKAIRVYWLAGGLFLGCVSLLFFLLAQGTRQVSDFWVRWWTADYFSWYADGTGSDMSPSVQYVVIYAGCVAAFIVFMLCRGAFFHWFTLGASQSLHKRMVHNVLSAPLSFFLQNPVGDLLVAFTKDQDLMDENLVDTLHYLGIYGLIMIATVITVSITINLFAVFAGVLFIVTFCMLWFYLPAATKLKKHKAESAGTLVGLVAETLEGLNVINAYDHNEYFVDIAAQKTDEHHAALYTGESLNLWLAFYCDLYGAILVLAVSLFAVIQKDTLGASAVGLAFSNTIQMLVFYTWSVRFMADFISLQSSNEVIAWLATEIPQEGAALHNKDNAHDEKEGQVIVAVDASTKGSAPAWPRSGVIEFNNVWMKYAPTAPFALKGVTFRMEHGEKAGVVGRTGSGKSTLLLALYRMFELEKGTISVDGRDVAGMALRKLRPSLSIIPQEPVVFTGSVRNNLDPWGEYNDNDLWEVIRKAGLTDAVKEAGGMDGHLDGSGGKAWSLGQKQLVCLCRAGLRKVPILCLDEATAAMDPHTEAEVQKIIKRMFSDRTTLTIAHRLDTVIESDKVLVMEQGVLKEFDAPKNLLDNRESMFSKLVDKSGAQAAALLRELADEYFANKAAGRPT